MREALKEQLKTHFAANGSSVNSDELDSAADALLSFAKLLMEADRKSGSKVLKSCLELPDDVEGFFA